MISSIVCKGKLISFDTPLVMGIINRTPDSFYEKSRKKEETVLFEVEKMLEEGATFIDIGGYSTRPNHQEISVAEELDRTVLSVAKISQCFPEAVLSIDTFRAKVAEEALKNGAHLVNDISGGLFDENMLSVVAQYQVPFVVSHLRGTPQTMMSPQNYSNLIPNILDELRVQIEKCQKLNIKDILIDVGFGFSKNIEQNFSLLHSLNHFIDYFSLPMLVGLSRKSMIWKTLENSPEEALNGTSLLNFLALQKGASILRVHDVKPAIEGIKLWKKIEKMNY